LSRNHEPETQWTLTPECEEGKISQVASRQQETSGDTMRLLPPRFFVRIIPPVLLFSLAAAMLAIAPSSVNQSMRLSASSQEQTPIAQSKVVQHSEVQFGDQYRGTTVHVQKGTGYFTVSKVGNRWTFVTPEGNAFWLLSIYGPNHSRMDSRVLAKYGGNWNLWCTHRNQRMLAWNLNTIGEYNYQEGLPIDVDGGHNANSVKLPFIEEINAMYAMRGNPTRYGINEPPKDIVPGVPTTTYHLWRGSRMSDMLDPRMSTAYHNVVTFLNNRVYNGGFNNIAWLIGLTTDDTDGLFGLKAISNPNVGYMIAAVKFIYTAAENGGVTPIDPHLYSKYAWTCGYAGIDFGFGVGQSYLGQKYGTIAALNTAWGTGGFYTSFCDDGGYGVGTGVLDEDGRHTTWFGNDPQYLTNTSPGLKIDMNQMFYWYAYAYAHAAVSSIRVYDTHHLIFSPMALGANGGYAPDPRVLQAFKDAGIGVFQIGGSSTGNADMRGPKATYDQTGLPVFLWYCTSSNADSPFSGTTPDGGCAPASTQGGRATQYATDVSTFLGAQGTNGDKYILGIDIWAWGDSAAWQHTNWGMLTNRDNAYDGKEAVRRAGTDSWGFRTGGEDRDYGDFLSTVRNTNFEIQQRLTRDLASFAQRPDKSKK
jgi:hypothetical protein